VVPVTTRGGTHAAAPRLSPLLLPAPPARLCTPPPATSRSFEVCGVRDTSWRVVPGLLGRGGGAGESGTRATTAPRAASPAAPAAPTRRCWRDGTRAAM